jgi:hypothetical protein
LIVISVPDSRGFLVNSCSVEAIESTWWPTVEATVGEYRQRYSDLLSVYIRGSVASGTASSGFSDVDAVAVLESEHGIDRHWCATAERRVLAKQQCASEITFSITSRESVVNDRKTGFFLKTHAVLVFGEDVAQRIEPYRIDHDAVTHLFNLRQDWATCERVCAKGEPDVSNVVLKRMVKRIVRSGFELVAEREQKYTRDLGLCSDIFAKYYPPRAQDMAKIASLLVDADLLVQVPALRSMVEWLAVKAQVAYPDHVTSVTYIDDLGVDC